MKAPDAPAGNALKTALLNSISHHRYTLAAAMTALLPSAQALAQCAAAPAALSVASGTCTDSNPAGTTTRSSGGSAAAVSVSGGGSYIGNLVDLEATGAAFGAQATGGTITLNGRPDGDGAYSDGGTFSHITTDAGIGLYAEAGGHVVADHTLLITNGDGAYGIMATGAGSTVSLTGFISPTGSSSDNQYVVTNGVGAHGAYAVSGGAITLTHADVLTSGEGASAFYAGAGGTVTVITSSGFIDADDTAGAQAVGAGASLVLNRSFINTYGNNSTGLFVTDTGTATVSSGAVVTGNYYGPLITGSAGIVARGPGSSVLVDTGASVSTYGTSSPGLSAEAGASIDFLGNGVFTYQSNSPGTVADGTGSTVTLTDTANRTSGPASAGVIARNGGTVRVTGTEVTTGFLPDNVPAVLDYDLVTQRGLEAHGVEVADAGSVVRVNDGSAITTLGAGAIGVLARDQGTAIITDSNITTNGASTANFTADGARATGAGSSITLTGAGVATYGADAAGLRALDHSTITATDATVETQERNAFGAHAQDAGSTITLTGGSIRTVGPSSDGLRVTGGGTIIVTGTEVTTGYYPDYGNTNGGPSPTYLLAEAGQEAHAAEVAGAGSLLRAENARITTTGTGAIGVLASGGGTAIITGGTIWTEGGRTPDFTADGARATGAGSSITLTGTAVTAQNTDAAGLRALQGGLVAATDVTILTNGQNGFGAHAQDAGSVITLTRGSIATTGDGAIGIQASSAGAVQISGGSVTASGAAAHGLAGIDGGTITAAGTAVAVTGAGAAAVYIAGSAPSTIAVTGGSLSAASAALVLAEGGTGTVSISGGTALTPAMVDGRLLLARATEDAAGNPANLTLNISGMPALTGDVVVDPSTLTYNLSNSAWTGNLVLTGPGNTATASLTASQWTGDLLADAGNTANVALAQASLWTGLARNATNVAIDAGSAWAVTADSNATGTVTNAGLIQFLPRGDAYTTLATGSYAGNNGRIGFNTFLGTDASPSNLLVITGGTATGSTSVLVANTGGPGALTTADGIRIVQVTGGGTTAAGAFTLGQRVAAGAYEYQLFRGGSTDPNDWFLRTSIVTGPAGPTEPSGPAGPTGPSDPTSPAAAPPAGPVIPLYRPEVALYAPIPAIARQMGLATLGTLHERVGEEENIRGLPDTRPYASGAWARAIGERTRSRWSGTVDSRAIGDTFGIQAGFDIIRTNPYSGGHRDQAGVYVAYTNYSAPSVSGFALGLQNLRVGRLSMEGPSVGAYWTHFGPSGWYLDAVFQASWYDVTARSDFGTGLSTNTTGYTASLEAGYPIHFGAGDRWLIEPQAQIIYQGISVDRARDAYSSVDWDEGDAWTGRLGARLQYTGRDEQGTLWQPYARLNLWHAFSGNDGTRFGQSAPTIDTRFGDTALEAGGGVTARVNQNLSFYGQASYRWSLDGGRSRQTAVAGTIGIRFNW